MILTDKYLRTCGVIKPETATNYRACSYDLTIGQLLDPQGGTVDEYLVPPQGLLKVVSAERVAMPDNLVGYVLVKTSLCNEGVLALNIGIVDPGFDGPLTSTLINFGKAAQRLRKGDVFSRLTVHELKEKVQPAVKQVTFQDACSEAKRQVDHFLAPTFLNIAATAQRAAEEVFGKYKMILFGYVPALALVLTLLTFSLNFGNMWLLQSYLKPQDQARTELLKADLQRQLDELVAENKRFRGELEALQRSGRRDMPSSTPGAPTIR